MPLTNCQARGHDAEMLRQNAARVVADGSSIAARMTAGWRDAPAGSQGDSGVTI